MAPEQSSDSKQQIFKFAWTETVMAPDESVRKQLL